MVPLTSTETLILAAPLVEILRDISCLLSVEEKQNSQINELSWNKVMILPVSKGNSPCPLLCLRFMGLNWEAKARRFCWRACCMRRCCSSASCIIFLSGPSVAAPPAPRSSLSLRCSNVAACASCCCCCWLSVRAMGSRLGSTGVDVSSDLKKMKSENNFKHGRKSEDKHKERKKGKWQHGSSSM